MLQRQPKLPVVQESHYFLADPVAVVVAAVGVGLADTDAAGSAVEPEGPTVVVVDVDNDDVKEGFPLQEIR